MKSQARYGVVFQPYAARAFLQGVNTVVDAVAPTLGPLGGAVAISAPDTNSKPELLDDGALIARRLIALADPDADMGAMYTRHMLWQLGERNGDGTATAAVIFRAILVEALRYTAAQGNAVRLREALNSRLDTMIAGLERQRIEPTTEQFKQIAEGICRDAGLAERLAAIFSVIGADGALDIRANNALEDYVEFIEGAYWKSDVFKAETSVQQRDLENVHVLVSDLSISQPDEAVHLIRTAVEAGVTHLLLIAGQVAEPVLGLFKSVSKPGRFEIVSVKTPGVSVQDQAAALEDLAILTGGQALYQAAGDTAASIRPNSFGTAGRVWVARDTFGIIDGSGAGEALDAQLARLKSAIPDDPKLREAHYRRIGLFSGGAAVLVIGGDTQKEAQERIALAKRAATVMRSVLRSGVVAGGGAALLALAHDLGAESHESDVEARAAQTILSRALRAPFEHIVTNAGYTPGAVMPGCGAGQGFDVKRGCVVDAVEAGLLDALEILCDVLYTSVTSAGQALTIDVLVHRRKPDVNTEP